MAATSGLIAGAYYIWVARRDSNGYPKGTHSIFGKAGHSQVQNNEWITFDRRPILRYLAEYDA